MTGNEAAHAAAREHTSRAFLPFHTRPATNVDDIALKFSEILQHHRLSRRTYPSPHKKLSKEEQVILRRLQTNTYVHGIIMHRLYPTEYSYTCTHCDVPDTLQHMVQDCPLRDTSPDPSSQAQQDDTRHEEQPNSAHFSTTTETWEAKLSSDDLDDQRSLVARAKEAAQARGFLE